MVLGLPGRKFSMTPSTVVRMTSKSAGRSDATSAGQLVVVAELDFSERHGVIFVDDGYDAAVEQCDECIARVEMAFMMLEVFVGEQHLRDAQIVRGEKFFVNRHELRLADGGAGLQFGEVGLARFS